MAIRTIAPGGGLWNSTSTWVEGAVPTSSDNVVGNASSGPLTVNVSTAAVLGYDLQNYNNTISFSTTSIRLNLTSGSVIIGSGVSWSVLSTSNGFYKTGTGSPVSFTQYGTTPIPRIDISNSGTYTFTNLYVSRFITATAGAISYSGNITVIDELTQTGSQVLGTAIFKVIGSSSTLNVQGASTFTVDIDTTGGTTTIGTIGFGGRNLIHTSGTISNPLIRISNSVSLPFPNIQYFNYDLISGTTWDFQMTTTLIGDTIMTLVKPITFNNFLLYSNDNTAPFYSLNISGNTYNINNLLVRNYVSGIALQYQNKLGIYPGTNVNVNNNIEMLGAINNNVLIYPTITIFSTTPGVQANLNVNTNNQNITNARITDINCSGGNKVYGTNLTLSNTTNITNLTFPLSGGETSSVFIS